MKNAFGWVLAAVVGASVMWGVVKLLDRGDAELEGTALDARGDGEAGAAGGRVPPMSRSAGGQDGSDASLSSGGDSTAGGVSATAKARDVGRGAGLPVLPAWSKSSPSLAGRAGSTPVHRAVEAGNPQADEARALRAIFAEGARTGRGEVVAAAARLLEVDGESSWRVRYLSYLAEHDVSGQGFAPQIARAAERVASAGPAELESAWDELSWAYRLAPAAAERHQVLGLLEPFLDTHVFGGRFSPLTRRYNVKAGDNLTRIASQFDTTVDAIMRLSGLSSETIQPRMSLRVLEGKVRVYVDKSDFRLWLTVTAPSGSERVLLDRPVGLGEANSTPTGRFVVEVRQKDPTWYRPGESAIPPGDPRNVLGTRWLGFKDSDQVSGIGIHGTIDESSIGLESSKGCVRMRREDVELVYDFVGRGTEVIIQE